jgi:DNA-binding MarR family transcriptional regulator
VAMTRPRSRAELSEALFSTGRALGTASAMFNQAVAERLGLLPTDWSCLSLLEQGPMPAGQLAKYTGLSTGAITGVIDRLEAAGYARRARDPSDRRRVLVEPVPEAVAGTMPVFAPMLADMGQMHARFRAAELEAIIEALRQGAEILHKHALRIRSNTSDDGHLLDDPRRS